MVFQDSAPRNDRTCVGGVDEWRLESFPAQQHSGFVESFQLIVH